MWIKLVAPRMSLRPMDSELKRRMAPPLALLAVAALTPEEHRVTLADENVGRLDLSDRPDLVGITVNVDTSARAYEIAAGYRARGVPVVLGGIHASACPEEAAAHADAVCIGDAEGLWPRLLADAAAGRLRAQYRHGHPLTGEAFPILRRDLFDHRAYLYDNVLSASRGCPYRCEFCYNSAAYVPRGHRPRPVADVVAEVAALGSRHVMFIDDNLIGHVGWARELVAALAPLQLKWNGAVSADIGRHEDLLDAMAESGCQSLFIGFESINPAALRQAGKRQNRIEFYSRTVDAIHARGMMVNASFVFGFDGDSPAIFPATRDWLVAQRVETMTAHILTPYPGTALHARLEAEGRIVDRDPRHYNTAHAVFEPRGMTRQELESGYRRLYAQVYSFANILRRLPRRPEQRMSYLLFNLGYRKFGKLTAFCGGGRAMHLVGRLGRRLAYGVK